MDFAVCAVAGSTELEAFDGAAIGNVPQRLARDRLYHRQHVLQAMRDLAVQHFLLKFGSHTLDASF